MTDTEPNTEVVKPKTKKTAKAKSARKRVIKYVRNIAIAIVIILILLIIAGVIYTWFMGQNVPESPETVLPKTNQTNVIKRPTVDPNAKVGVSLQTLDTPVVPGSNTSMSVKTNPGAKCTITAVYNKVPSTDSGLTSKIADEYGLVSWSWTVETSTPLGKWPVTVTCANAKNSGVYKGDLVVAK